MSSFHRQGSYALNLERQDARSYFLKVSFSEAEIPRIPQRNDYRDCWRDEDWAVDETEHFSMKSGEVSEGFNSLSAQEIHGTASRGH